MRILTSALLAIFLAAPSYSAVCFPREELMDHLFDKYGETIQSEGLTKNNGYMELMANEEKGTWTIVLTSVNGTSCVTYVGNNYDENETTMTKMKHQVVSLRSLAV